MGTGRGDGPEGDHMEGGVSIEYPDYPVSPDVFDRTYEKAEKNG